LDAVVAYFISIVHPIARVQDFSHGSCSNRGSDYRDKRADYKPNFHLAHCGFPFKRTEPNTAVGQPYVSPFAECIEQTPLSSTPPHPPRANSSNPTIGSAVSMPYFPSWNLVGARWRKTEGISKRLNFGNGLAVAATHMLSLHVAMASRRNWLAASASTVAKNGGRCPFLKLPSILIPASGHHGRPKCKK
jgi:hypothetical protein